MRYSSYSEPGLLVVLAFGVQDLRPPSRQKPDSGEGKLAPLSLDSVDRPLNHGPTESSGFPSMSVGETVTIFSILISLL